MQLDSNPDAAAHPPGDDPPADDPRGALLLKDLVDLCLSRMEVEGDGALEALCAAHPGHADGLRRRIAWLRDVGLLADAAQPAEADGAAAAGPPAADADGATPRDGPDRLGEYRLLQKLGSGGMGVVYLAEQESVGRRVALKLIRPELLYFDNARARFRREVESAGRLEHPGIVAIHAIGEADGVPFFSMGYVDGLSLGAVLEALRTRDVTGLRGKDLADLLGADPETARTAFGGTWTEVCFRLLHQAAVAVEHAHRQGVLHRDLKPSNLMVTRDGRVVVVDFGLASIEGAAKLTRTTAQLGSLEYMSPEQIRGEREQLDRRSDVYALGVTLYELLTLRAPFAARSEEMVRRRILEGRPRSVRAANPRVPGDAETVCLTAMDPDPKRRYASAGDFARDLDNWLGLRPITARRPGSALRLRRWAQRNPARAVAAALAAVLVIGGPLGIAWLEHAAGVRIRRERDAAEQSLEFAFEALQEMGTDLAQTELLHLPRGQELRRKVLANTLRFYERFLDERGDDPRVWSATARAHSRMSEIHRELGDLDASERARLAAEELYAKLLARRPAAFVERYFLLDDRKRHASILVEQGRAAEAVPILARVAADLETLRRERPADREVARLSAVVWHNLSIAHQRLGQKAERDRCLRRALTIRPPAGAADAEHLAVLCRCHTMRVHYLHRDGELEAAERACAEGFAAYRELMALQPENRSGREGFAELHEQRGFLQRDAGRLTAALDDFETALGLRRRLTADFPTMPEVRHELAGNLTNLANLQLELRRPAEAEAAAAEAMEHERLALEADPTHAMYREFMYRHVLTRTNAQRALGRHRDATALCAELPTFARDPAQGHHAAAAVLAKCIPLCARDAGASAAERAELADAYGRRAVEHLRQALAAGHRGIDFDARGFEPLRERADFAALRAGAPPPDAGGARAPSGERGRAR